MTLTIHNHLHLSDLKVNQILKNSIERVLNNAIWVGQKAEGSSDEALSERASTLWQDCEELKELVVLLWESTRESILIAKTQEKEQSK